MADHASGASCFLAAGEMLATQLSLHSAVSSLSFSLSWSLCFSVGSVSEAHHHRTNKKRAEGSVGERAAGETDGGGHERETASTARG